MALGFFITYYDKKSGFSLLIIFVLCDKIWITLYTWEKFFYYNWIIYYFLLNLVYIYYDKWKTPTVFYWGGVIMEKERLEKIKKACKNQLISIFEEINNYVLSEFVVLEYDEVDSLSLLRIKDTDFITEIELKKWIKAIEIYTKSQMEYDNNIPYIFYYNSYMNEIIITQNDNVPCDERYCINIKDILDMYE